MTLTSRQRLTHALLVGPCFVHYIDARLCPRICLNLSLSSLDEAHFFSHCKYCLNLFHTPDRARKSTAWYQCETEDTVGNFTRATTHTHFFLMTDYLISIKHGMHRRFWVTRSTCCLACCCQVLEHIPGDAPHYIAYCRLIPYMTLATFPTRVKTLPDKTKWSLLTSQHSLLQILAPVLV